MANIISLLIALQFFFFAWFFRYIRRFIKREIKRSGYVKQIEKDFQSFLLELNQAAEQIVSIIEKQAGQRKETEKQEEVIRALNEQMKQYSDAWSKRYTEQKEQLDYQLHQQKMLSLSQEQEREVSRQELGKIMQEMDLLQKELQLQQEELKALELTQQSQQQKAPAEELSNETAGSSVAPPQVPPPSPNDQKTDHHAISREQRREIIQLSRLGFSPAIISRKTGAPVHLIEILVNTESLLEP